MLESKEIETEHIFLDTSVFVQENFMAGTKLQAFISHARNGKIKLYVTEITRQECLNKLLEFSEEALDNLSKKNKVLKNLSDVKKLVDEKDKTISRLKKQFEEEVLVNFSTIKIDYSLGKEVFKSYFEQKPPFDSIKKKNEFPDAFVLTSLDSWAKKKKTRIYVVYKDSDFDRFESKQLIQIKEYDRLLNSITHTFSAKRVVEKLQEYIEKNEKEIGEQIVSLLELEFPPVGYDTNQGFEYELNDIQFGNYYIQDYFLIWNDDKNASVELTFNTEYEAILEYFNPFEDSVDEDQDFGDIELKVHINFAIDIRVRKADIRIVDLSIIKGIPTNLSVTSSIVGKVENLRQTRLF